MNQEEMDEWRRDRMSPKRKQDWIHEPETESSGDWFALAILLLMMGFIMSLMLMAKYVLN